MIKLNKKITIVLVTYNSMVYLPECLESIARQSYPKELVQIIAVDNGSSDDSISYIKENYPNIKVIKNKKNTGFTGGNNQGHFLAQKNKSDYLVLLNQDTIVDPNWLEHMIGVVEKDDKIGAVQAKLLLHPEKNLLNSFGNSIHYLGFAFCDRYREEDRGNATEPFEVPYPSGAAVLIKMSALEKTGLFDDRFFLYHEDVDLGWRLRLAGYKIMFDPLAVVYHKYNYSKAKYKFYYIERNRWMVILQNYKLPTLLLILPPLLVMELGQIAYSIKNGWLKEKLLGLGWIIFHFPSILSHRAEVQFKIRDKKVKDRDILKLFVGSIKFQEVKYPLLTYVVNPLMEVYFWIIKKIIFW